MLRTKALASLSSASYHDIDKVVSTFESMLCRDLGFDKIGLKRIIHIRHDIVHRNRVNKEGVEHVIDRSAALDAMTEIKLSAPELRSIIGHLPN